MQESLYGLTPICSIVDCMIDFSIFSYMFNPTFGFIYFCFLFIWAIAAHYYKHKYQVIKHKYDVLLLESVKIQRQPVLPKTKLDIERDQYLELRSKILLRDNFKCQECGYYKHLEVHHIIPRSKGGSDDPENLVTLCQRCHDKKHGREYRETNGFKHNKRNHRKKRKQWRRKNKQLCHEEVVLAQQQRHTQPKNAKPNRRRQLYEKWERDELNQTN
jgi:5-methylcytosine-specific restriction endonuclease McrA